MGVRISDRSNVCLYCSTEGVAFGPVFRDAYDAHEFLDWLTENDGRDAREIPGGSLENLFREWQEEERDGDKTDTEIYGAGV